MKIKQAFTLVELIVVITILAILGTIAFLSFQGYSRDARDSVRISDLNNISRGMEFMLTKTGRLPMPEDSVEITASGTIISYQGYAGENVLSTIGVNNGGKDPKDDDYYTYLSNANYNKYQILGFLENGDQILLSELNQVNADLSERFPISEGFELGIFLNNTSNSPIQITGSGIDILNTSIEYKAKISNTKSITGTGGVLINVGSYSNSFDSCNAIIQEYGYGINDGVYKIYKNGNKLGEEVYCDMETDGGGWTRIGDNHLTNGNFSGGLGILSEDGSNINNDIILINSPSESGYALHQTGDYGSEYEVHFDDISLAKVGFEIRMSAWIADTTGSVFHYRQYYTDESQKSENPYGDLLDTQIIDGKTWEYKRHRTTIDKDLDKFNWYAGYAAETDGYTDLYMTDFRLELFYR